MGKKGKKQKKNIWQLCWFCLYMYVTFDFNASKYFINDRVNFACIIGAPFIYQLHSIPHYSLSSRWSTTSRPYLIFRWQIKESALCLHWRLEMKLRTCKRKIFLWENTNTPRMSFISMHICTKESTFYHSKNKPKNPT